MPWSREGRSHKILKRFAIRKPLEAKEHSKTARIGGSGIPLSHEKSQVLREKGDPSTPIAQKPS